MPALKSIMVREIFRREMAKRPPRNDINETRKGLDEMGGRASVAIGTRIEPVVFAGVPGEWLIPENDDKTHVLLYLHGGAYSVGSCESHRGMVSQYAKACGARALLPEYRLAPEHPFPSGLEDATAVYTELLKTYAPEQIAIVGDSAGGGLTLATIQALREKQIPLPASIALISAWTDLLATGQSMHTRAKKDPWFNPDGVVEAAQLYYQSEDPKNPKVSPVFADYTGFPPMLLHVGDWEILLNDSTRVAQKAREQGVDVTLEIWDGMWHVWHAFYDQVPEGLQAITQVGEFVQKHW